METHRKNPHFLPCDGADWEYFTAKKKKSKATRGGNYMRK